MAEDMTARRLRVVRAARRATDADEPADRAAYWARMQTLRAERQRLRAG
ncbi:hypothetical protein LL946_05625 [Knoellia locipacati]